MIKLPVNPADAVVGDCELDLPYVVTGDHSVVVIDRHGQQWPVFWGNVGTVVKHGGIKPSFSNLDIPDNVPYLKETFPKIWNYDQSQIHDTECWHDMFVRLAGIKADGSDTMQGTGQGRGIKVTSVDPDNLQMQDMVARLQPHDPREPVGNMEPCDAEGNYIGVILASAQIKSKRSAFKPRVYMDRVSVSSLPDAAYKDNSFSMPAVKKHVRKIFPSQRRCQWTLCGNNFLQIESPIKLIRYLSAVGFVPTKLIPSGEMLRDVHELSFLAEYNGALFSFTNDTHSHYNTWRCTMFSDSDHHRYAPYSIPGFDFGSFHLDRDNARFRPIKLDMGSFNFVGSRGVPAPLENMARFALATKHTTRRHDTRPFRYALQIRYRWSQVISLVDQVMGNVMSQFIWTCTTIPGPSLVHEVKWNAMPDNLRFTMDSTRAIEQALKDWAAQFNSVLGIKLAFGSDTVEVPQDGEDYMFNRVTPFTAAIYMSDITPVNDQAGIMASLFAELPGIIEKVVEDDPHNCQ